MCTILEWILPFIALQRLPSCLLAICWQCKLKYFCTISIRVIISIYYWLCRFSFCRFWCIVEMTSMVLFLCSGKSLLTAYRHLRCHKFFFCLFVCRSHSHFFVLARIIWRYRNSEHAHQTNISNIKKATQTFFIRTGEKTTWGRARKKKWTALVQSRQNQKKIIEKNLGEK